MPGYSIGGVIYPSVSRILKADPKNVLAKKSAALNSSLLSCDEAKVRGSAVHRALRSYLITGEADLEDRYMGYWEQVQNAMQVLDLKPRWADGPLLSQDAHLQQGEHACVWSQRLKVQGCPDFFGTVGGVNVVGELKTGTAPFSKHYMHGNFKEYWNYFQHRRALLQAAAYSFCIEEAADFKADAAIVINVTPKSSQIFISEGPELERARTGFKKLAKSFLKGEGNIYTQQAEF